MSASTHRLHPQHTGRTESDAVVAAQPHGRSCSSCLTPLPQFEKPAFHCDPCDYTICASCNRPNSHPAHPDDHHLYLITPISTWICDTCKSNNTALQEIQCYHCEQCDSDLCKKCFSGVNSPLQHPHILYRTDARNVYHEFNGKWFCDICRNNNGEGHHYPSHCSSCEFDLCDNCIKPWKSTFHPGHIIYKADSNLVYPTFNGRWTCDRCSLIFIPQVNNTPFHCSQCEFDLCGDCMETTSETLNTGISETRSGFPISDKGKPIASPGEEPFGCTGSPDNAGYCVMCRTRAKDASIIIHGETSHVCCCISCAKALFKENDVCPICRAPIDNVIRHYT